MLRKSVRMLRGCYAQAASGSAMRSVVFCRGFSSNGTSSVSQKNSSSNSESSAAAAAAAGVNISGSSIFNNNNNNTTSNIGGNVSKSSSNSNNNFGNSSSSTNLNASSRMQHTQPTASSISSSSAGPTMAEMAAMTAASRNQSGEIGGGGGVKKQQHRHQDHPHPHHHHPPPPPSLHHGSIPNAEECAECNVPCAVRRLPPEAMASANSSSSSSPSSSTASPHQHQHQHPEYDSCWACEAKVGRDSFFCQSCSKIQPPGETHHFALLRCPKRFDLDLKQLEANYWQLQKKLHPDHFYRSTEREQEFSVQQAASVNEAYQTLKQPHLRAKYMLELMGVELNENTKAVDPEILMEVLSAREEIEEASQEGLEKLKDENDAKLNRLMEETSIAFQREDSKTALKCTTRLQYLCRLDAELRQRMHVK